LAIEVCKTADTVEKWCKEAENIVEADAFEEKLVKCFDCCFSYGGKVCKKQRESMWTEYCALCTLKAYEDLWYDFLLKQVGINEVSVIFCQYIGNYVRTQRAGQNTFSTVRH